MELTNALYTFSEKPLNGGLARETARNLLLMLAPFAPHITAELWNRLFFGYGKIQGDDEAESDL